RLHREANTGARDTAVRENGWLVGGSRPSTAAVRVEPIWSRKDACDLRRLEAGGKGISRIGAGIDRDLGIERQQPALGVGVSGDVVVVLAAIGVGGELLAAVLDPPHGLPEPARKEPGADLLGEQDALVAETAADVG